MFDPEDPGPDYELAWPAAIFTAEATGLLPSNKLQRTDWANQVEWLLTEAFVSDVPHNEFLDAATAASDADPWASHAQKAVARLSGPPQQRLFKRIVSAVERLPEQCAPKSYYADRHGRRIEAAEPAGRSAQLERDWRKAVEDLIAHGYLDKAAPRPCIDDKNGAPGAPDLALDHAFADRLGTGGLWSSGQDVDRATFYSMIEVVHDLVARPRQRWYHAFNQCGWHYSAFAIAPRANALPVEGQPVVGPQRCWSTSG